MSYISPTKIDEALEVLSRGSGKIIAGGTDVYPSAQLGQHPDFYMDVTRIDGLKRISVSKDIVHFGSAVTWTDIINADLGSAFDALKATAREVGSVQIQNAATLAGNVCNASPAADGVPPLLALDASVELASRAQGSRLLPLAEFITGVRSTVLRRDEMVVGLQVPVPPSTMTSAFEKLGSRRYLVISICMTAVNLVLDQDNRITDARIAVGACSAVAQRLPALEASVIGQRPADVEIKPEFLAPLTPINDVRGAAAYRYDVVQEQCRRAIMQAASR
ncbi:FAD binding domain-containing protein [Litoreibacter roseus]|uniref:Xanthine dehydrogenase n=1 Tax=Litoreibacter roseus TaxID=2601869 RepID=A0A6N6JEZ6_9RHOB|nr:FAD binding domain-containing protein [Litoreibacter roseus]GFE63868.1 xanthine dehydrogenase [Litoreibacter roseus]